MIPVALPSTEWLLTVGGLLLLSAIWVIWSLILLISSTSRKRLVNIRLVIYLLCAASAAFVVYKVYMASVETDKAMQKLQKEYHPVLSHPQRIGQIDMPAQTKLSLAQANTLESFQRAEFPHPINIAGIHALKLERYLSYDLDETYTHGTYTPEDMRITGTGTAQQAGWHCDASQPVKFTLHADGTIAAFDKCQLAEGNQVDGVAIPAGTSVMSSTGNTWTDGFVDQDRWQLDTRAVSSQNNIVEVDGLPLVGPWMYLDKNRQIYMITFAELARTVTFGGISHPKGTSVSLNPRAVREHYAGAWVFSPQNPEIDLDIASGTDSNTDVKQDKHNIVQDRSGHVLARDIPY